MDPGVLLLLLRLLMVFLLLSQFSFISALVRILSVYQDPPTDYPMPEDIEQNCLHLLDIPAVATPDVSKATEWHDVNSATGLDHIPSFIIKVVKDVLSPVITSIFNWRLITSSFPCIWKHTLVTRISNPGTPKLHNFRAISVLSNVLEIFERIVYDHLYSFVRPKISLQHGFIAGHSTN